MLIVCLNEDKEGCLVATWFDEENADRGGFVETIQPMDDWWGEEVFPRAVRGILSVGRKAADGFL